MSCLRAGRVDIEYLVRYTNAPWLVIDAPGTAEDGLFARDEKERILCWDREAQAAVPALEGEPSPAMKGVYTLPDGRAAKPVFQLLAERYLDESYGPDAVADRVGVAAATIRRIAAELAEAAFEHEVVIDEPWTDWTGRRHDKIVGRRCQYARDARDLGAFEWIPHLPCDPYIADSAGQHRPPRRHALQAAVS